MNNIGTTPISNDTFLKDYNCLIGNMIAGGAVEKARFRPHHMFCDRFLKVTFPDRGGEFEQVSQKRRDIIERQDAAVVEVIE